MGGIIVIGIKDQITNSKEFQMGEFNKVRVTIPVSIAYNLKELQGSISSLAEIIGHPACFSGVDCTFMRERVMRVDAESLQIASVPLLEDKLSIGTWPTPEREVTVVLPNRVSQDIKLVDKAMVNLMTRLGCPECHSGWDISLVAEQTIMNRFQDMKSIMERGIMVER